MSSSLKIKIIFKVLSWSLVLVCMTVIFTLSAQPAYKSNKMSKSAARGTIAVGERAGLVNRGTSKDVKTINVFNNKLRNFAHAAVYFVLGVMVFIAFRISGVKGFKCFIFTVIFCAAYACLDEFHQLFVPGRGLQLQDLALDLVGAFLGLMVSILFYPRFEIIK